MPATDGGRRRNFPARWSRAALPAIALCLTACLPVTRPVVKIALVAPFEGRYREVGYEVIYAVRLAVREANAAGGVAGHSVELLALDDSGDPALAREQARKVAADPDVMAGIGHWLEGTTASALGEYDARQIPWLATASTPDLGSTAFRLWPANWDSVAGLPSGLACPAPCDSLEDLGWLAAARATAPSGRAIVGPPLWAQTQFAVLAGPAAEGVHVLAPAPLPADSADPLFAGRYQAISGGVMPRTYAVLAYDGARVLLDAIARAARAERRPTRQAVLAALAHTEAMGLSGAMGFDAGRARVGQSGWLYRWQDGSLVAP